MSVPENSLVPGNAGFFWRSAQTNDLQAVLQEIYKIARQGFGRCLRAGNVRSARYGTLLSHILKGLVSKMQKV